MLDNKIPVPSIKQSGFSLVELMVALVLGLLITAAVTAMTVNSLKMSGATLKSARLNQDLGAVMQIMVNDIRRAGYSYCDKASYECARDDNGEEQSYITYATGEDIHIGDADGDDPPDDNYCILYSYNRNADPLIDNEMNGFKLDGGGIKMRTSCDLDTNPNCPTDCSLGTWVELTDPGIVTITDFEVNSENSKCHNIDRDVSIRIMPGASATEFACNEPDKDNLQEGVVDSNGDWSWGSLSLDLTITMNDSLKSYGLKSSNPATYSVGVRHVNILLSGVFNDPFVEAGSDYSEHPIRKSLDVSIKVKNDHVYRCTLADQEKCPFNGS